MVSLSRTIKLESSPPTSRVEYINGKYPGSIRLGLEVCVFSASYDGYQEPAPDELIKIRWCNCRVMLKNPFSRNTVLATPVGLNA